ncbi:Protein O-linked-mannose beta-1,4-N-acetylglucosaminyltransferase 2 [Nowakowskiella sp. JEL0407]|nr:Protein O-linked-mannose beta-1,4-N-acetylglucosaminyltransferase 2 [Nowakowskiella sp. JEL0407]
MNSPQLNPVARQRLISSPWFSVRNRNKLSTAFILILLFASFLYFQQSSSLENYVSSHSSIVSDPDLLINSLTLSDLRNQVKKLREENKALLSKINGMETLKSTECSRSNAEKLEPTISVPIVDSSNEQVKVEDTPAQRGKSIDTVTPIKKIEILPSGEAWCYGNQTEEREQLWVLPKTNRTVLYNVPQKRFQMMEDTSVVGNHWFTFSDIDPYSSDYRNISVRYEEELHFIIWRWEPGNIMHFLHDDVMPLYYRMKEFLGHTAKPESGEPFSIEHRILAWDYFGYKYPVTPYEYLTYKPLRFQDYLYQKPQVLTCFRDAIVGSSHLTTWYQYGVKGTKRSPQGPLDKYVNGMHVREFADWMAMKVGANPADLLRAGKEYSDLVVIITRGKDRLIVNQNELASRLTKETGLESVFMSMENHTYVDQIRLMRRAKVVVGMHGSLLIMGMFCRRGTVLIELFPYAVPSKNYSPYRTMSNLPGMGLLYEAWENNYENNSIPHPERDWRHGGLETATPEDLEEIKARWIPHKGGTPISWLYRIYQDTIVHLDEVSAMINRLLSVSKEKYAFQYDPKELNRAEPMINNLRPGPFGDETAGGHLWDEGIISIPLAPPIIHKHPCTYVHQKESDTWKVVLKWKARKLSSKVVQWQVYASEMKRGDDNDSKKWVQVNPETFVVGGEVREFEMPGTYKEGAMIRYTVRGKDAKGEVSDWGIVRDCHIGSS